ncbi:MAG: SUMF1/EgtB/PvdO family nonheme iron enzyme, partial [Polyangiales bacterium]
HCRSMPRVAVLAIVAIVSIVSGVTGKTKIPPPLEKQSQADSSGAVVMLAPPIEGMIAFAAGTFEMGSGALDQKVALATCKQEVLGSACRYEQFAGEGLQRLGKDSSGKDVLEIVPGARSVKLGAYLLDRTEVTVAAYQRCVELGECRAPGFSPGDPKHDRPDLPVTDVTWDDAARFCAFRSARLPTEAEWERAARGSSGRTYPWGMLPNPKLANLGALDVGSVIVPSSSSSALAGLILAGVPDDHDGFVGLAPVGSFPMGGTPEGIVDLAGNAAEWVADVWEDGYDPAELVDPGGPSAGVLRVVRGGSYRQPMPLIRGASRVFRFPSTRDPDVGFRCARTRTAS